MIELRQGSVLANFDRSSAFTLLAAAVTVLAIWFLRPDPEKAVPFEVDIPEAVKATSLDALEILDEPSIHVAGSTIIQCYSPANGRLLGHIQPSTADDIDRAIESAKEAQTSWAKTTYTQRRKVLQTLLKYILAHQNDIARAACLDSGKTRVDASFGEILVTAEKLVWTIKHGEKALVPDTRPTSFLMMYKHNEVRYEPLGVVAALVSWNYPFHNLLNPIISSLFTGNAIVVKASEQTAWSAQFYTSIVRGALKSNGHSPQLVQSIVCWPSVAPHLTSHPDIAHVTFIGSRPVAHHVAASAAKSLTPVCAELGGKDAAIVLDDVSDLNKVGSILMRGVFQSAGQNCIGIERVIAQPKVYDRLVHMIAPRVKALRLGSALDDEESVDVGACISAASFDRLEALVKDAVSRGATLHAGGSRYSHPRHPKGHYFQPTFLSGVTTDMPIAQQELFAPIFTLLKADTVDDAISIANSTPYSLGASVFGGNSATLDRVSREVRAGMVSINDFASYYMCSLPFGGVKGSGYGRFGGPEGLRALCNVKSVNKDRFWGIMSTSIPPRLDYVADAEKQSQAGAKAKAWEFVRGIVETGYGIGVAGKAKGIAKIISNA